MDEIAIGAMSLSARDQVLDFGGDAQKGVSVTASSSSSASSLSSCCAICLEKIELQEIALVKGCEHAYCVTCILRWATYIKNPICPQCKNPFEFLILHRALDGRIHDYMLEESVCLLLRANWFEPLRIVVREEVTDEREDYYPYEEDEDDCMDDFYFSGASSLRIGNRRWGSNGYVRTGRREARPVSREGFQDPDHAGSSRSTPNKKKEVKVGNGRRAKRAMKREAADKAAATAATAVTAANAAATVTAAKG